MKTVFNLEPMPHGTPAMFLAGPTPRSREVASWRPQALDILAQLGFDGAVVIPEDRTPDGRTDFEYAGQIDWERACLKASDIVVFWVPRCLTDMPAFTTNIEFGFVSERGQPFVLGYPVDSPKMRYLAHVANECNRPVFHTMEETLGYACRFIKEQK